ncbi:MAG: hypothetical protein QM764_23890 [Chitinophagaceae bacterium]
MQDAIIKKRDSLKSPFRGMLIFVIVLFILAILVYRSKPSSPLIKSGKTDAAGAIQSRDTTHPE